MRFNLGDTIFWVEASTRYGKRVPCCMCFGKGLVTLILGDGSYSQVECGFCSHGLERATGQMTIWEPHARIESGHITGISTRDGLKYEVGHRSVSESEAFTSEEAAALEREKRYAEEVERAKKYFEDSFVDCKKSQIWNAGYHRHCIEYAERTIEWHKLRLGMIKEKHTQKTDQRT